MSHEHNRSPYLPSRLKAVQLLFSLPEKFIQWRTVRGGEKIARFGPIFEKNTVSRRRFPLFVPNGTRLRDNIPFDKGLNLSPTRSRTLLSYFDDAGQAVEGDNQLVQNIPPDDNFIRLVVRNDFGVRVKVPIPKATAYIVTRYRTPEILRVPTPRRMLAGMRVASNQGSDATRFGASGASQFHYG